MYFPEPCLKYGNLSNKKNDEYAPLPFGYYYFLNWTKNTLTGVLLSNKHTLYLSLILHCTMEHGWNIPRGQGVCQLRACQYEGEFDFFRLKKNAYV